MGTIYAVANQKGGVGKTTTAVNVAACVADAGYETLLVDLDPQCNATVGLGLAKDLSPSPTILSGDAARRAARATAIERLSVVPSTPDLAGATVELPRLSGLETRLRDPPRRHPRAVPVHGPRLPAVAGPAHGQRPRGRRPCARARPDRVLRPRGPRRLLDTLALIQRELNPRLAVAGMILTMHDGRTRLAQDVEHEVREHFPDLVFAP